MHYNPKLFFCSNSESSLSIFAGESRSRLRPGQSRGFWAKPGQANHYFCSPIAPNFNRRARGRVIQTYTKSKIMLILIIACGTRRAPCTINVFESCINLFSNLKVEENKRSADGFKPGPNREHQKAVALSDV
jgi:hypothetical protein